jgi:outer membrane protein assembly factor BamA
MEVTMRRQSVKQALFLAFLTIILFFVLGFIIVTSVKSETPAPAFRGLSVDRYFDSDDEEDDYSNSRHRLGRHTYRSDFEVRYNRVEGVYLGMAAKKPTSRWWSSSKSSLFGFWGYAFSAKEFQYQIGLEKGFFEDFRLAFGGEYHRRVDTPDRWIISDDENSCAAFFIREDFHDYYYSEGASGWISQNITPALQITAGYEDDKTDSLDRHAKWSLFGGKKRFRENPAMDAGEFHVATGRLVFDTRNSVKRTTSGWYLQAEAERAGGDFGGDFTYDRVLVDLRRYQPLGFGEGVDIRLRAGSSHGILPWQKSYHLGGLSTLRGYAYKAFPDGWAMPGGNRMVLAQIEYRTGNEDLPDGLDFGLLDEFNLILFNDVGWVADAGPDAAIQEGFDDLTFRGFKHDVGLALANHSGNVRFEIARRTDTGHRPYSFMFRCSRPF